MINRREAGADAAQETGTIEKGRGKINARRVGIVGSVHKNEPTRPTPRVLHRVHLIERPKIAQLIRVARAIVGHAKENVLKADSNIVHAPTTREAAPNSRSFRRSPMFPWRSFYCQKAILLMRCSAVSRPRW
jgi:hypothetical protein